MKLDIIKSVVAVVISALLAYACYEICKYESVQTLAAIGSFLTIATPLMCAIGVEIKAERTSVVLKVLSWVVLLAEVVTNGIFICFDFSNPAYIIVNGLILVLYLLIYSSIYKKQM